MRYSVYPILLFALCLAFLTTGLLTATSFSTVKWLLLLVPIPSVLAGLMLTTLIATWFPRIRYVNESEIDGLGHVHQPLGPMLAACVIGFAVAIAQILG